MTAAAAMIDMCQPFWDEVIARDPITRLLRRDYTLWKPTPQEISNRLGWLDLPDSMRGAVDELREFAAEVRDADFRDVVLLGMGGSSLCAEVLRQIFVRQADFPRLRVLDSTVPASVAALRRSIDPAKTLFLVSSKSGGTIEVLSFYKYFRELLQRVKGDQAGRNFAAITDSGTGLERMASEYGFRRTFINPSDVGGRYSALSYFGLVPAALMGLDPAEILGRARRMAGACSSNEKPQKNPGARLGLVTGCLAKAGRDKLTIVTSPSLTDFGLWAEQLVAESTGKEGRGVVPIAQEPLGPVEVYGDDRLFIYLRLADDDNEAVDRHIEALKRAGCPLIRIEISDRYDLAGEFFRWEFAIALAGACLEINPFDQPNVQESKENTGRVLTEYGRTRALQELRDEGRFDELLSSAQPGDYLALMLFAEATPELEEVIANLRRELLIKHRLPTTFGYGPRFLHSTGQLHKGGANNGLFVQITCEAENEIPVPGTSYGFGTLAAAQAIGDFDALRDHGRRVIRIHVRKGEDPAQRIRGLAGQTGRVE